MDPNGLSTIVENLTSHMFPSKTVVEIDSIIVHSLFGPRAKKKEGRLHRIQTLSVQCAVDEKMATNIHNAFELEKKGLDLGNPKAYLETAKRIAACIYRQSSLIKGAGSESQNVTFWCIAAYSIVINPASTVKLSCVKMGKDERLGFAIHAQTDIKKGQSIRELIGLMPKDGKAQHSELSCVKPNASQNQSPRVERVLFGPIRFINHICSTPNTELLAVDDTSAFYVVAVRDIAAGEELLLDYGRSWFAHEPDGCPCQTCKPDQQAKKRKAEEKDEATVKAEKAEKKKAKRKRTREKKEAKWAEANTQ